MLLPTWILLYRSTQKIVDTFSTSAAIHEKSKSLFSASIRAFSYEASLNDFIAFSEAEYNYKTQVLSMRPLLE